MQITPIGERAVRGSAAEESRVKGHRYRQQKPQKRSLGFHRG